MRWIGFIGPLPTLAIIALAGLVTTAYVCDPESTLSFFAWLVPTSAGTLIGTWLGVSLVSALRRREIRRYGISFW